VYAIPPVPPTPEPFRYSPYPDTPTLSRDAFQTTEMEPTVQPVAVKLPGTVGGCESAVEQADVVADTGAVAERLPTASYASTPNAYVVPHARPTYV
jgi:hypothetical protein